MFSHAASFKAIAMISILIADDLDMAIAIVFYFALFPKLFAEGRFATKILNEFEYFIDVRDAHTILW